MTPEVIIKKNEFKDSVILMNASQALKQNKNIKGALVVMGTDSNKDILRDLDLMSEEIEHTGPNDLIIAYKVKNKSNSSELKSFIAGLFDQEVETGLDKIRKNYTSIREAKESNPDSNIALISVPGRFAFYEAKKALELEMHVVLFSANVPLEKEAELKRIAHEKNLLCMGPDCGVCNLNGYALVLASIVRTGKVGIVGPSGSGLQEISVLIEDIGVGISQVIGSGGRDLDGSIGGITTRDGIRLLNADNNTEIIVVFLKKCSDTVLDSIREELRHCCKPIVICFLGGDRDFVQLGNCITTCNLGETAQIVRSIVESQNIKPVKPFAENEKKYIQRAESVKKSLKNAKSNFMGIFGAGTFMSQTEILFKEFGVDVFRFEESDYHPESANSHTVIDLGDGKYTEGRPHPVIDLLPYRLQIQKAAGLANSGLILFDVILGPAMHPNPAGYIVETLQEMKSRNNSITYVAVVCGSWNDPQDKRKQVQLLEEAGVIVFTSITEAAYFCILVLRNDPVQAALDRIYESLPGNRKLSSSLNKCTDRTKIFSKPVEIINIGVELFKDSLQSQKALVHHVEWRPPAGGDIQVIQNLEQIKMDTRLYNAIESANSEAYSRMIEGEPVWTDVAKAGDVVPGLEKNMILHTGPPIEIEDMNFSHRNGVIGGILFEGLADTPEEAIERVKSGKIKLLPGIDLGSPNGGMAPTTYSMPVIVVEDRVNGTQAFCPIQEGPSYQALRWGVFNKEVEERWRWFQTVFGPALHVVLRKAGGYNLKANVARSLQMGDENHSREHGSTLLMIAELAGELVKLDLPQNELYRIFTFLNSAERFALHVHIAGAYSVLRSVRDVPNATVVYAMGGNGRRIGIKVSAAGDEWFTADAPYILGRYLNPNWTVEDTVPFAGDSCVVEIYGLGGLAAAASPAVTLMAGGTMEDACNRTREMWKITVGKNQNYAIPNLDFGGTPAGIDVLKVIETGIVPQSHAGIIHKEGGQAGAGVAYIPMECFIKAFAAVSKKIDPGINK
jgi:succinyl-CoA synthetase alpha subunit